MKKIYGFLLVLLLVLAAGGCASDAELQLEAEEGWQGAAEEFLSTMTSIFVNVYMEVAEWEVTNVPVRTGRFMLWHGQGEIFGMAVDYEPQGIFFVPEATHGHHRLVFYYNNDRVDYAPWLIVQHFAEHGIEWATHHFAEYFRLFDFDGSGIPDILIHFRQIFEGGYAGFYRIFRYIDGEYRMLEMAAYDKNGEPLPDWQAWIGQGHELLQDSYDRLIVFVNSEYHGLLRYHHLVFIDTHAELHLVVEPDNEQLLEWQKHHWPGFVVTEEGWHDWANATSWLEKDYPTIFGTDIVLARIPSLTDLEREIDSLIRSRLAITAD